MMYGLILILGAVAMGAGAVKLFGVFEIGGSDASSSEAVEAPDARASLARPRGLARVW